MAGSHLITESHIDRDHLTHHADPTRATRIVGVHTTSEPYLVEQESGEKSLYLKPIYTMPTHIYNHV